MFSDFFLFDILNKVISIGYMKSFLAVAVSDAFKICLFLILLFFDCFSRCLYFDLKKAFRGIFYLSACTITQYILTQVYALIIRLFDPFDLRYNLLFLFPLIYAGTLRLLCRRIFCGVTTFFLCRGIIDIGQLEVSHVQLFSTDAHYLDRTCLFAIVVEDTCLLQAVSIITSIYCYFFHLYKL